MAFPGIRLADLVSIVDRLLPLSTDKPLLGAGEVGVEASTGKLKVGDGVTPWPVLPFFTGSSGGGGARPVYSGETIYITIPGDNNLDDFAIPADTSILLLTGGDGNSIFISGFAGGTAGRTLLIYNHTTDTVQFQGESANSAPENRLSGGGQANVLLIPERSMTLVYSTTVSRWIVVTPTLGDN